MRIATLLRWALYPAAALLIAAGLAVQWLWHTESGARFVLGEVTARVEGVSFHYLHGSLASGVEVADAVYSTPQLRVATPILTVKPDLVQLLSKHIGFSRIAATDLTVTYKADETAASSAAPSAPVSLGVPIVLEQVQAARVTLNINDQAPQVFDYVSTSADIRGETLKLSDIELGHAYGQVKGRLALGLNAPWQYSGDYRLVELDHFGPGRQVITGGIHGDKNGLRIDGRLQAPGEGSLVAKLDFGQASKLEFRATIQHLDLAPFTGQAMSINGARIALIGPLSAMKLAAVFDWANPWVSNVAVQTHGMVDGKHVSLSDVQLDADRFKLNGQASLGFSDLNLVGSLGGEAGNKAFKGQWDLMLGSPQGISGTASLRAGDNQLALETTSPGTIALTLAVPDPASLLSSVSGGITGQARFNQSDGSFEVTLSGDRVGYGALSATTTKAYASGKIDGRIKANVSVASLAQATTSLGGGQVRFAGDWVRSGMVTVDWQRDTVSASLVSSIASMDKGVSGEVSSGKISVNGTDWTLGKPAGFQAAAAGSRLSDQCWRHDVSSICISKAEFADGRGHIQLRAHQFRQGSFSSKDFMAEASVTDGHFTVTAQGGAEINPGPQAIGIELQASSLSGTAANWQYEVKAAVDSPWLERANVSIDGSGDAQAVQVDALGIKSRELDLGGSASFAWAKPALKLDLAGTARAQKVTAVAKLQGGLRHLGGNARLGFGDNQLSLDAKDGNIDLDIAAPDLASIDPALKGRVDFNGHFDVATGEFTAKGKSARLEIGTYALSSLQLDGTHKGDAMTASVAVDNVRLGGESLGSGKLTFNGKVQQGNATLDWRLPGGQVSVASALGVKDGQLSGTLDTGRLVLGGETWTLQSKPAFSVSSGTWRLDDHCWQREGSAFCVTNTGLGGSVASLGLHLTNFPLHIDKPWYAPDVDLAGDLDVEIQGTVNLSGDNPVYNGTASFSMPQGQLSYFDVPSLAVNLVSGVGVKDNVLTSQVSFHTDNGEFIGKLAMPDMLHPKALRADANLDVSDLGMVTAFVPQLDKASGTLKAIARYDARKAPLDANLSVKVSDDASVDVPLAGVTLTRLKLDATGDENDIKVSASAHSGDGDVKASGDIASAFASARHMKFRISGTGVTLLNRSDLFLVASPDLSFEYGKDGGRRIAGSLGIDDGKFTMKDGTVESRTPSSDVVIVSGETAAPPQSRLDLHLDVNVKKFSVDMYGLNAGVNGSVVLTQTGSAPRRAVGNVNLVDGTFARYGQKFDIDRGRLIFSGPLENPLVDVLSSRTITNAADTIKVSLHLSGPANNISSTITSDPPMSGARALSYLVLGRPLDSASTAEGQSLSGAAISLGLKQALPITDEIKSALGLSELTVKGDGVDSTSVVAGKKVGPDLYVEYDYDVFSRIGGILFNYQLTPRLSLQTRSGEAKSMQIIYTF